MKLSQQQMQRLADTHAVYLEFMQRIGSQEVPLLLQQHDSSQENGSAGSSSNGSSGSSSSSSTIAALQSLSGLQQNMQLWAQVNQLQRKVSGKDCCTNFESRRLPPW
jgi:hypothetical protein